MFKFTFNIGSHIFNPFTAQAQTQEQGNNSATIRSTTTQSFSSREDGIRRLPAPPRRFVVDSVDGVDDVDATPVLTPLSRKRGWAPSSSSPSAPISLAASTNGWLDTPSRYVEAAAAGVGVPQSEYHDQDFPPAKRRKTITDSILSTALSAALIGTAVGMSAYRMWRDRGLTKQTPDTTTDETIIDHPPPPYAQEDWVHATVPQIKSVPVVPTPQYSHSSPSLPPIPRTPKSVRTSKARRSAKVARYRASPASTPVLSSPRRRLSPSKAPSTYFNDPGADPEDELDVQIHSMDDKIRKLIEEGQKALGKEVVIMNDDDRFNEEGAVDDGLDGWEEVDEDNSFTSLRIPGNGRKKRRPSNASNANGNYSTAPSTSLPSRLNTDDHGHHLAHQHHHHRPVSPKQRRPRALTGTSRLGSPDTSPSVQVIYEPLNSFEHSAPGVQFESEDQDSLNLSQRMEKIRQAFRIQ